MSIVGVLGLVFALVFGLVAFVSLIGLNTDIQTLTSGGIASLAGFIPHLFILLVGVIVIVMVIAVVKGLG